MGNGTGIRGNTSGFTGINGNECTSGSNRMLNSKTKLGEFGPYGQFYSPQINKGIDGNGSGLEEGGYQDECFEGPKDMKYDLTLLECVNEGTSSQIYIEDPLLKSFPIGRDVIYYVDSNSTKSIELGTKKYPFKHLELVSMEILNFFSHSNQNIIIYIKERTIISLSKFRNFYIDIPNIQIDTYSDTDLTPLRAKMQIVNEQTSYFSDSTQFNIISGVLLRLNEALNYAGYTSVEKDISSYSTAILIVNRGSLSISNIDVNRNITSDKNFDVPFITSIYEQSHTVSLKNMSLHISGRILKSNQPMNLYVENVYIDFYGLMGGFYINAICNYPEASIIGSIFITNVTAINSQTRVADFKRGILYYSGPANITIQNSNILIYGSLVDETNETEIQLDNEGLPNDGVVQTITVKNNIVSLSSNPYNDRFIEIFIDITSSYSRKLIANFENNQLVNIVNSIYPVFHGTFTSISNVYFINNTIYNVSAQQGVIFVSSINSTTLMNSNIYNLSDFGHNLYYFSNVQNAIIQNIILQNINATGKSTDYVFLFDIVNKGTVSINMISMSNVNIGLQAGFYFNGLMSMISYTNMYFSNIVIGDNNRMLSSGEHNSITMKNITFINIFDQFSSDSENYLFVIDKVNLNGGTNSSIEEINVQVSGVDFLSMESIVGSTLTPIYMNFINIIYKDCLFEFMESLIVLLNVQTQEQFYIIFDNATFKNITFQSGGYFIDFGLQMLTKIIIKNSVFSNIFTGIIHIEKYNKNLQYNINLLVQNCSFTQISSSTRSIFELNEGSVLEIRNSSFNQVSCTDRGGVLYGGNKNTITSIYDSSFTNNTSIKAALFLIEDGGVIKLYNCSIIQNFAITAGLIVANNNGYFEIYKSSIHQNYAMENIISEITSSSYTSVIDSTNIFNNEIISKSDINTEFTIACKILCFVPSDMRSTIISNPSLYNYDLGSKIFETISSSLVVMNNSIIYNQISIGRFFLSTFKITDSIIYNSQTRDYSIKCFSSTVNITSNMIYNIATLDSTNFVFAGVSTIINIENSTYLNSSCSFISSTIAVINISSLNLINGYAQQEGMMILRAPNTTISNLNISYSFANNSIPSFFISDSIIDSITNVSISNINQYALRVYSSYIKLIDGLCINKTYGMYIDSSIIDKIQNSMFTNNWISNDQTFTLDKGGGIYFTNSNFSIFSSTFYNNSAKYGGAIYISGDLQFRCLTSISYGNFTSNLASISGGGIMYNLYRPVLTKLIFSNNSAMYGPDIASYAIKLKIDSKINSSITINNVVSGQIGQAFKFSILDYDDQVMILDSSSKITVKSNTNNTQTMGKIIGVVKEGAIEMSEIIFISAPGSTNITFSVIPSSIDMKIARAVYGADYNLPAIVANFRYGKPGEYSYLNQGFSGSQNSYSLTWNSTQGKQGLENASCEGDEVVNVNAGYWRKTTNSTFIVLGPNEEAGNGGYNSTNIYPVNGENGYKGILGSKGTNYNGDRYEKSTNSQGIKGASQIIIYIRLIGIGLVFIFVILFIIYLKRKEGNNRTVLMRIMTNYIQIMTTALAYNMSNPKAATNMFTPIQYIGSGITTAFSLDGFSSSSQFSIFAPSSSIFKMLLMAISPILLGGIISFILGIIALVLRESIKDFKRDLIASNVVILLLILPTLEDSALSLFQGIEIDIGDYRVSVDTDIIGYSFQHILWGFLLSIPMLLIWVFGTQILILLYLIKHRK